jgi:hypothetical protein
VELMTGEWEGADELKNLKLSTVLICLNSALWNCCFTQHHPPLLPSLKFMVSNGRSDVERGSQRAICFDAQG